MGREVRRVPANWQHPKYPDDFYETHRQGRYVPLDDGDYEIAASDWDAAWQKWNQHLREDYGGDGPKWIPRDPADDALRYTEYAGQRPSPDDYMPRWPEAERTHLMMYETTSEGTPISPAFATPEELARWLADNEASAFGGMTATYEQWLSAARGGWAPSAVLVGGHLESGVAASLPSVPAGGA